MQFAISMVLISVAALVFLIVVERLSASQARERRGSGEVKNPDPAGNERIDTLRPGCIVGRMPRDFCHGLLDPGVPRRATGYAISGHSQPNAPPVSRA